ncbi:MAG TPA: tetratricopeptide repeat protein [Burkholderiaceae bacterium]|nr:tetratricopeptide repeat protein [Burkholderiaceae bacterium]
MHTLLFTDVVDSTLLVERVGDARAAQIWSQHDRLARDLLAQHRGREIDRTDGFFLLFDTARDAVGFALAYHRAIGVLGLEARAGLHTGEVTLRGNDAADVARGAKPLEVEGLAKPVAARIMALARGGQTLASAAARDALGDVLGDALPPDCEVVSHGHYRLKGVEQPIELFEVGRRPHARFEPPPDADKGYRVVRAGALWSPVRLVRHNLAPERDAFVGRAAELRAIAREFESGRRLLTLLGPGGTGKTRVIRRFGLAWLGDWPGGVYFCDLAEVRTTDALAYAVALALGVPLGKDDPIAQLGNAIAGRGRCLVILDNFEQIVALAPASVGAWLDRASEAHFAVTSRERLHLHGEAILEVEPLPLADDALTLFAERAAAQRPGFALDATNRADAAEVVRLLDGLPLAIELAAARLRVLSPAQLVERLKDRFTLLAGARGAAARQSTMKIAIDWSWNLLAAWEQAALAQCSVFEGGFTLEAAEAVLDLSAWADAPPAIDAVQSLVDKSLLRTWNPSLPQRFDLGEPYFGMYLSIHEYAAAKLGASAAATLAAQRLHGRYYARLGRQEALDALARHGGARRLPALALEIDNLIGACRRAVARADAAVAVPTLRAAWEVLDRRGPFSTGVDLGAQVSALDALDAPNAAAAGLVHALALRRIGRPADARDALQTALAQARSGGNRLLEAITLAQSGMLQSHAGQFDEARAKVTAALGIAREIGNRRWEGGFESNLGNLDLAQGLLPGAGAHTEAALAIHREIGDRRAEGGALCNLAVLHHDQGELDAALAHYEAALVVLREVGDRLAESIALGNLGTLYNDRGQLGPARATYEAALVIHREIGDRLGEVVTLGNLAKLATDDGRRDDARVGYETALSIARELGERREMGIMLGGLGGLYAHQGRLDDAQQHYEQALAIHRQIGNRRYEGETLANLAELLQRRGLQAEARAALDAGEALLREIADPLDLAKLLCVRGHVELGSGARDAARGALDEAQRIAREIGAEASSELMQQIAHLRTALG